jgi:hypothetical protein
MFAGNSARNMMRRTVISDVQKPGDSFWLSGRPVGLRGSIRLPWIRQHRIRLRRACLLRASLLWPRLLPDTHQRARHGTTLTRLGRLFDSQRRIDFHAVALPSMLGVCWPPTAIPSLRHPEPRRAVSACDRACLSSPVRPAATGSASPNRVTVQC